jgi:hypothetical protein
LISIDESDGDTVQEDINAVQAKLVTSAPIQTRGRRRAVRHLITRLPLASSSSSSY